MAIFIHSFFRSSSTYFWSKFRESEKYKCYYEPFHEIFAKINLKTINEHSEREWKSGHPQLKKPYFYEYINLLNEDGIGCRDYDINFAFSQIIPTEDEFFQQKIWVDNIIEDAFADFKIPVFGFCRSFLRINHFVKNYKKSLNIVQIKNPVDIFYSAYNQLKKNNNPYFCAVYSLIIKYNQEKFCELKKYSEKVNLPEVNFDYFNDMQNYNVRALNSSEDILINEFVIIFALFLKITDFKKCLVINLDKIALCGSYRFIKNILFKLKGVSLSFDDIELNSYSKDISLKNNFNKNFNFVLNNYFNEVDSKKIKKQFKKYFIIKNYV